MQSSVEASKLPAQLKLALRLQKACALFAFPFLYVLSTLVMRFGYGYKIKALKSFRRNLHKVLKQTDKPIIICANHLTKIDSLIILWAMGSLWYYCVNFKKFAWNLPEQNRYFHNIFLRIFCYIGCCIPVVRGGDREQVNTSLNKICYLIEDKHLTMVFPEGKRGLKGRIDTEDYSYGVGRIIQRIDDCQVLCIYMRGDKQQAKSDFPARNEQFYIDAKLIQPSSQKSGLRQIRELSSQIITQLSNMESEYLDADRK